MLIGRNAEGVYGQRKVENPWSITHAVMHLTVMHLTGSLTNV